jgi:hypothetical protein
MSTNAIFRIAHRFAVEMSAAGRHAQARFLEGDGASAWLAGFRSAISE